MFCYQCEQTDRSNNLLAGCASVRGNCGKDAQTADLQDVLNHVCLGIGQYAVALRGLGRPDPEFANHAAYALFTTLTNVNFNPTRFVTLIAEATALRDRARAAYEQAMRAAGREPKDLGGASTFVPETTMAGLLAQAPAVRVDAGRDVLGDDVVGVRSLNLYGLKGICAYTHHAHVLGYRTDEVDAGIEAGLAFLADPPTELEPLLEHALVLGGLSLKVMELLDAANTGTFGHPVPTTVFTTPRKGKAVLVSGHDLGDLKAILEATKDAGVDVYTHGEMLPAHGYPQLHAYPHLAGNIGGAWQHQQRDFAAFPGPIVMTSNCLTEPQGSYRQRIFTMGPVGWPGVRHLTHDQLGQVVRAAQALPGFTEEVADSGRASIMTGFARESVLGVADTVIDAVKSGAISRFLLIGGCDGAVPGRNYYTEVADQSADDTVLLTLGCNKYRFNTHEYGTIGELPRLLDVGQCNDAYSALRIAMALADAFECGVNDLPLSLFVSWFEQKAAAVLLALLALDIKHIRLGPSLPAFLTPAAVDVLGQRFGLLPIGDASQDLADAMAGH